VGVRISTPRNDKLPDEMPDLTKPCLLTYGQAARVLGISVVCLERWKRQGIIKSVEFGQARRRTVRFSSATLLGIINGG
jgi:hypothetical protein